MTKDTPSQTERNNPGTETAAPQKNTREKTDTDTNTRTKTDTNTTEETGADPLFLAVAGTETTTPAPCSMKPLRRRSRALPWRQWKSLPRRPRRFGRVSKVNRVSPPPRLKRRFRQRTMRQYRRKRTPPPPPSLTAPTPLLKESEQRAARPDAAVPEETMPTALQDLQGSGEKTGITVSGQTETPVRTTAALAPSAVLAIEGSDEALPGLSQGSGTNTFGNGPGNGVGNDGNSAGNGFAPSDTNAQNARQTPEQNPQPAPQPAFTPQAAAPATAKPVEIMPQVGAAASQPQQASAAQATQRPQPPRPVVVPQQILDQVKVNITRAAQEGADRITIQLKPAELGRIEVKLEVQANGQVQAIVTADRPETLDVLRQDARGLERALQDAGLKTDPNGLSFILRGEQQQQQQSHAQNGARDNGGGEG